MNGILSASSGLPFTISVSDNTSGDASNRDSDRPNLVPGRSNNPVLGNVEQWYDPSAFELPAKGPNGETFYGNLGRNTVEGPGLTTFDFSLVKNFNISETNSLIFRAEFFNIFNHANFGLPARFGFSASGVAGNAGRITDLTTASRQIQFGLRYTF